MTYIFTFHPLISCLDAVNYLGNRRHQVVLQTEEKTTTRRFAFLDWEMGRWQW